MSTAATATATATTATATAPANENLPANNNRTVEEKKMRIKESLQKQ